MVLSSLIAKIVDRVEAYRSYRRRVRELETLSDREMSELGINRADIYWLASQG